jgi:hypothetical protein
MRLFKVLLPAIAAGLSACGTPLPDSTVDSSYVFVGMEWQGGGGVYVSIKTFDDQGKVALCGAYSAYNEDDPRDAFAALALANMYVRLGDKIIANNIEFFNHVAFHDGQAPLGQSACKRTRIDWKTEYAFLRPDLKIGKHRYVIYD